MPLLLKNCNLVDNSNCDILIENGKIIDIKKNISFSDNVIDIKNKFVIPGIIDCHVHFREPGLSHKEDWFSGSCSASKGGITTVLDMPNTIDPIFTKKDLDLKRKLAKKSIINYGFHFGADNSDNTNEIFNIKNIASTKIYMNSTTGDLLIKNKKLIEKIFKVSKIISTHSENKELELAVELSKKYNKKLYLCHITSKKEIEFIKKNKTQNIFCELTPHHLFFNNKNTENDPLLKVLPSIKTETDRISLWNALNNGLIDTIATDHAPHLLAEKNSKNCPAGIPGVETMLPFLLNNVNKKNISLKKVVELVCENPTKIFKIKNKGYLKIGFDADITVIDMNLEKTIKNNDILSKCKWSAFNNIKFKGFPVITIVNGNIVYYYGKIFKNKGKEVEFYDI